jgi:hypothetical protein
MQAGKMVDGNKIYHCIRFHKIRLTMVKIVAYGDFFKNRSGLRARILSLPLEMNPDSSLLYHSSQPDRRRDSEHLLRRPQITRFAGLIE